MYVCMSERFAASGVDEYIEALQEFRPFAHFDCSHFAEVKKCRAVAPLITLCIRV